MSAQRVRLPEIGTPTERLLSGYAADLLASLRRVGTASTVSVEVKRAEKALRRSLNARELCSRLATRADELAEIAEAALETEIRALYDPLSSTPSVRERLFPDGLGGALSPRGDAQAAEVMRLLEVAQGMHDQLPPSVTPILVRIGAANAVLSARFSTARSAHEALVAAIAAEQREQRAFRERCLWAHGALVGIFPRDAAKVAAMFKGSLRTRSSKALPAAPPPTPRPTGKGRKAPAARKGR
jgi:hypothetical protein